MRAEDPDDFDDLPSTSLDDDAYDEFLAREFDADGQLRDERSITRFILLAIAVLAVAMVLLFWR